MSEATNAAKDRAVVAVMELHERARTAEVAAERALAENDRDGWRSRAEAAWAVRDQARDKNARLRAALERLTSSIEARSGGRSRGDSAWMMWGSAEFDEFLAAAQAARDELSREQHDA